MSFLHNRFGQRHVKTGFLDLEGLRWGVDGMGWNGVMCVCDVDGRMWMVGCVCTWGLTVLGPGRAGFHSLCVVLSVSAGCLLPVGGRDPG